MQSSASDESAGEIMSGIGCLVGRALPNSRGQKRDCQCWTISALAATVSLREGTPRRIGPSESHLEGCPLRVSIRGTGGRAATRAIRDKES